MRETGNSNRIPETPMRAHFSTTLPRLAVAASLVALCAGTAPAYDEDAVKDNLQPYIGAWLGLYQVETMDLEYLVARCRGSKTPRLDIFNPVAPAGGISVGVAYGRIHVGANVGYQLRDGEDFSKAKQAEYSVHPSYKYEVIPVDLSLDLAVLPNEYPINLLVGGSIGVAFVNIQNPFLGLAVSKDSSGVFTGYDQYIKDNVWETNNFLLATGYVGARINLARRLNLEGQLGYRVLRTDAIQSENGPNPAQLDYTSYDSTGTPIGGSLKSIPVDLSGVYLRADLRWTFASKADKEREARLEKRREVLERLDARYALKN